MLKSSGRVGTTTLHIARNSMFDLALILSGDRKLQRGITASREQQAILPRCLRRQSNAKKIEDPVAAGESVSESARPSITGFGG